MVSRLSLVAVLVLAPVVLAGCSDGFGPGAPSTTSPTAEEASVPGAGSVEPPSATFDVDLDYEPADVGGTLAVRYSWTNESEEPLLVVDRPGTNGKPADPDAVYVVGVGEERLQVSQRLFERPADDTGDYAQPFYAGVTEVPPGGTVQRRLEMMLPAEEAKPYPGFHADGETPLPTSTTEVVFCLGVLVPPYAEGYVIERDGERLVTHDDVDRQALYCSDAAEVS